MASKEAEEKCSNTKTGEETTLKKQRSKSRRVSFAETTAVHLFVRDEEYETPPESVERSRLLRSESDEIRELLTADSGNGDNGDADDDDDDNRNEIFAQSPFFEPLESPSSGSCFGSATSNDEDNFFGPVSSDFIKPGRLSDSAASEENHDVTMDSTAFSMHFRSLAKSDLGGEVKTPNGASLEFGERTFSQVSSTSGGDLMILTASRKRKSGSLIADTINTSGYSDDMSLVGENPRRYDYGELPPDLELLFAEDGNNVGAVSQTSNAKYSNPNNSFEVNAGFGSPENGLILVDSNDRGVDTHHVSDVKKTSGGSISARHANIDKKRDNVQHATLAETTHNTANTDDDLFPVIVYDDQTKASILLTNVMPVDKDVEARRASVEASRKCASSLLNSQSQLNHEQPIADSVSSLLAQRGQIFKVSPNAKSNLSVAKRKFGYKGNKHVLSASSVEKGVSRLESVPFVSASKVEGNASRLKPPESLNSSLTQKMLWKSGSEDASSNCLVAPVVCLDAQFMKVAEDDGKFQSMGNIGTCDMRSFEGSQYVSYTEVEDAELLSQSMTCSRDKYTKFTGGSVSPALPKEKNSEPMSRVIHTEETVPSSRSDCSLLECTYNNSNCEKETRIPISTTFFPETSSERKVSASPLYEGSPPMNRNLQTKASIRQDQDVKQTKKDHLACGSVYSFTERKEKTKRSTCVTEHSKIITHEKQNVESIIDKSDKASDPCRLVIGSANADNGTASSTAFKGNNVKSDAGSGPTSDDIADEVPMQVSETFNEDLSGMMLQKKACLPDGNAFLFVGNSVSTPISNELTGNDKLLLKQSNTYNSDSSSSLKRKLFEKADGCVRKPTSFQPKADTEEDTMLPQSRGGYATARDWVDVFTSFCGMNKLFPSVSINRLSLAQIRMLNDIVGRLDKMKSYELVHRGMYSQKSFDPATFLQVKRLIGTKTLLHKILYQKAKLQLMHLERDKLLDQVRQLDSRVKDSKILIASCHGSCIRGQMDARKGFFSPVNPSKTSLVGAEIHSLRKELEVSDRGIRNLKESFNAHIKILKEPTSTEPSVQIRNYLRKRVACQSVQSEAQLCQVGSINAMDGERNFLFDYGGIMSQRFIEKSNSTYGLYISNSLNNERISKMFHFVDACAAFSFTLSGQCNLAHFGFQNIARETQRATSLLHTVLDVVDEVELAMLELRNLTNSSFLQPSAGKLDLRLCFTDFSCGATVTLSFDISCLNRGLYPSEVLPYEVQGRVAKRHKSFESLVDKIKNDVRDVRCGYMRILSLCRLVSRTIQANCM